MPDGVHIPLSGIVVSIDMYEGFVVEQPEESFTEDHSIWYLPLRPSAAWVVLPVVFVVVIWCIRHRGSTWIVSSSAVPSWFVVLVLAVDSIGAAHRLSVNIAKLVVFDGLLVRFAS